MTVSFFCEVVVVTLSGLAVTIKELQLHFGCGIRVSYSGLSR